MTSPVDDVFAEVAALRAGKLWGASMIATFLGVSESWVYDLAKDPDCPIYKPSGRYFAIKSELVEWLRTKPG